VKKTSNAEKKNQLNLAKELQIALHLGTLGMRGKKMEKSTLFQKYGTSVEAGRVIFEEGETGDTMYIIQRGRVKITKKVVEVDKILMVLGKGDFFGEMALIRQTKRTATATAVDDCELLTFNRNSFFNMISKNSNIAMNIIETLCLRLEKADNQIRDLAKKDLKSLVISAFNDLRRTERSKIQGEQAASILKYQDTIRNIALQINAQEKEVESIIDLLVASGFLSTDKKIIRVLKIEELDKLAGYFKR
jgi:CRP/FNR family cyclic AMP-dependent transcriptional regulator